LQDRKWISAIKRNPSRQVLVEYLLLWELLARHAPNNLTEEADTISWRWTSNGQYSASSAYQMQLVGRIHSSTFPQIWKAKATPKCLLHSWILLHNKCLTADNLEKRGWPHNPICRLCFIHPETASHISASCPYARTVWFLVLAQLNLPQALAPNASTDCLDDWWQHCSRIVPKVIKTRWRSLALLTWWMLWKERNNRIFNNVACVEASLADKIVDELNQWRAAGVLGTSWPAGE
jgi:hypothetical protein